MIDPFYEQTEVLAREDIADGVAYMVTRPRHSGIGGYGQCPQNSSDRIRAPGAFSSDGGSPSGDGDRRRTSARSQPVNSRPATGTRHDHWPVSVIQCCRSPNWLDELDYTRPG
jgi:hypothetical protein